MKKYFLTLIIGLFILLTSYSPAFASVLYSNDFKSTYSNFQEFFGSCSTSGNGLICTGTDTFYKNQLNNLMCVSANFNNENSDLSKPDFLTISNAAIVQGGLPTRFMEISFHTGTNIVFVDQEGTGVQDTGVNTPLGTHNYGICKNNDTYTLYLDNQLILTTSRSGNTGGYFGLQLFPNDFATNLIVTDSLPVTPSPTPTPSPIPSPSPTPTPSPTPSPTPTPTPIPTVTPIQLKVPLIKQNDKKWKKLLYDRADDWSPSNDSIGTWGCALTSATMVLNYYRINTLPGPAKTHINPYTLDAWLSVAPDGYIGDGLVNWLAISRLSREAKPNNLYFPYDALQFDRVGWTDTATLLADLKNGIPDILEEPGHFIVESGQNGNTYTINDPYYSRTLLSDYGNTFYSLERLLPSLTNLSYMLFTVDSNVTLTLKTASGKTIGNSYTQQPLHGAGTSLVGGVPINILSVPKPPDGNYQLIITGSKNKLYTLKGYFYDKNGLVKTFTLIGIVSPGNLNTVRLNYKQNSTSSDSEQKAVNINIFLNDLNNLYKLGSVKKDAYYFLKNSISKIQKNYKNKNLVKEYLTQMDEFLEDSKSLFIKKSAYQILFNDIKSLRNK